MVLPIIAGIAAGCVVYYAFRIAPRITSRVAQAEAQQAVARKLRPYSFFEYGFQPTMTREEACLMLGYTPAEARAATPPSEQDVKQRYRRLVKVLHSDVSGSSFINYKLNEAKNILIK